MSGRDGLGIAAQLVPGIATILAVPSTRLWQQAPCDQGSPTSTVTDSTAATSPASPNTPPTPAWPPRSVAHQPPRKVTNSKLPATEEVQCSGPPGQHLQGDRVSMSEKPAPAPLASSYQTSGSHLPESQAAPAGSGQGVPWRRGQDAREEQSGLAPLQATVETQAQPVPPRALGVRTILNPPEPSLPSAEGPARHVPRARGHGDVGPLYQGPQGPARPYLAGQGGLESHPRVPSLPISLSGLPDAEHRNPPNYALGGAPPAPTGPRRILSPRTQRASTFSYGGPPRDQEPRISQRLPRSPPAKRPYEPDAGEAHTGFSVPAHPQSSVPHTPTLPASAMSRSSSQTLSQHPGEPHAPPHVAHPSGRTSAPPLQVPLQSPGALGHPFLPPTPSGPPSEQRPPSWTEEVHRFGMGGPMMAGEGQQAYMSLPGIGGQMIPVTVDTSHGSKKADEKRQRNAKASTRHRRKRKAMQEQSARQLQDLRDGREEMLLKIEELTAQRDFYVGERDRLRGIVASTPGISELAAGPPSPPTVTRPIRTPSHEYTSEDSPTERPAQRLRLDDRPDISMPSYGTPTMGPSAAQTPAQGAFFGSSTRPTSASSSTGGAERLPPLRSIEGMPAAAQAAPAPHVPTHEQDPRTGQWVPIKPRQFETGWATVPQAKPGDGPRR